jgi:imidazolonepropionase-like amidohydrolase
VNTLDITGGMLIDGTGAKPRRPGGLRIVDERIVAVWDGASTPSELTTPADRTIDATGMSVMPGLIDAHVHMSYGEGKTAEELDVYSSAEWSAIRSIWNARKVLNAGVTTIVDPGGMYNVSVAVRDAISNGMFPGPRSYCAGRHISADGGFADYFPSWIGMPASAEGVLCGTRDEMLREIRRQIKNRVDFIKLSGDSQAQEKNLAAGPCFTDEEFRAMIDIAHQLGRKVTIHARHAETIFKATTFGIDWIYHASHLRERDLELVKNAGVFLCPTLTFAMNIIDYGKECGSSQKQIDLRKREVDALARTYVMARKAGIPIMSGTESGFSMCPYGDWHARELELLVQLCGLSPMEAIVAATFTNARAIGADQDVGSLQAGRYGDVLIVSGDPLQRIGLLQDPSNIVSVIKGGVEIERVPVAPRRRMSHESGFAVSTTLLARDPRTMNAYAALP